MQDRLGQICLELRAVEIREYERDPIAARRELLPRVRGLVERTIDLLGLVAARTGDGRNASAADEGNTAQRPPPWRDPRRFRRELEVLVTRPRRTPDQVADIAHLGSCELRGLRACLVRLERLGDDADHAEVVGRCSSTLGHSMSAVTATENAVSESEGLPPRLSFVTELAGVLDLRRAWTKFRRSIPAPGSPEDLDDSGCGTVESRLRSAGTCIARLMGRDSYFRLRFDDRMMLGTFQRRIIDWLTERPTHAQEGRRLWQDLHGFVGMLDELGNRAELLEHDRDLVRTVVAALDAVAAPEVPDAQWARLRDLFGRDGEADDLLCARERSAEIWTAVLRRLDKILTPEMPRSTPQDGPLTGGSREADERSFDWDEEASSSRVEVPAEFLEQMRRRRERSESA